MIDFHSHLLPGIDDGSSGLNESVGLLKLLSDQKIDTVVATPHFIANRESVDSFVERRKESFAKLETSVSPSFPNIKLGAEVAYYDGISRLEGLGKLFIEGTDILLLEMPCSKWSTSTVRELYSITSSGMMRVMLAHIERCLFMQSTEVAEHLLESGVIMQSNASFFAGMMTKRKACRLLRNGVIHVLGSDCHNLTVRPPRLGEALNVIEKRLGSRAIGQIDRFGKSLLA